MKRIMIALVLVMAWVQCAHANIQIGYDTIDAPGYIYTKGNPVPVEDVQVEIDHFNNTMFFVDKNIKVNITGQIARPEDNPKYYVYGLALSMDAYIYEHPGYTQWHRSTVAHELGHLIRRYEHISPIEYRKFRGVDIPNNEYSNDEELVAEDFRMLFGSKEARKRPYIIPCSPPGEKEKKWILERITPSKETLDIVSAINSVATLDIPYSNKAASIKTILDKTYETKLLLYYDYHTEKKMASVIIGDCWIDLSDNSIKRNDIPSGAKYDTIQSAIDAFNRFEHYETIGYDKQFDPKSTTCTRGNKMFEVK